MFTIFDEEQETYIQVEEPDYSLTYTYADYLIWKYEERLELIRGKIFKMSPAPNPVHQQLTMKISGELFLFLKGTQCQVYPAPLDVRLPVQNRKKDHEVTTVVQPDVCVICDLSKIDDKGCCGAPDLVVEILSPGNSRKEVRLKFELYEEAGVKEYWLVNPAEQNLVVYVQKEAGKFEGGKMYTDGDQLESWAVPGFILEVSEIFTR
ncbi:MAG: Uma2 family endonuclease [Williamsia sp.]|nr:Uma2 family endonuclease [Williamsia sp.]